MWCGVAWRGVGISACRLLCLLQLLLGKVGCD